MRPHPQFCNFYYETVEEFSAALPDPGRTALLIVDMQNEFILRDSREAQEFRARGEWERWLPFHDRLDQLVIPNNLRLLEYFRAHGLTVTFARIACLRRDGKDRSPVQKAEGWNGIFLPADSDGAQIIAPLAPRADEIVVNKTTDSVTTGTNYLTLLRFMGIDTVVVTGIVTDQCVACTVRGLADAGLKVLCVEDACAAGSMELHNAELKIMSVIYCDVLSTDETLQLLDKSIAEAGFRPEEARQKPAGA